MRFPYLLAFACLTLACASERGDQPEQPVAGEDRKSPEPAVEEPPVREQNATEPVFEGSRVSVSDGPLFFALELGSSGMSGSRVGDGDYLTLSGPPGGPLMLRAYPATVGADVKKLVAALRPDATLVDSRVTVHGERPAVAWVTGESHARTLWCAVIVSRGDAAPGRPALLLELGVGHQGDGVDCKIAREHHVLGPVIDSLAFE